MSFRVIKTDKSTCRADRRMLNKLIACGLVAAYHDGVKWIAVSGSNVARRNHDTIRPEEAGS